jgi:ribosomal protein S18 acetylase RimI-like enzyme
MRSTDVAIIEEEKPFIVTDELFQFINDNVRAYGAGLQAGAQLVADHIWTAIHREKEEIMGYGWVIPPSAPMNISCIDIAIFPNFQGKSVGSMLLVHIIEELRKKGELIIGVQVNPNGDENKRDKSKRIIRWLMRIGFRLIPTQKTSYSIYSGLSDEEYIDKCVFPIYFFKDITEFKVTDFWAYDPMPLQLVIHNFQQEYYKTLEEQLEFYKDTTVFFPQFLKGKRKIVFNVLRDAMVVIHYFSDKPKNENHALISEFNLAEYTKMTNRIMELPDDFNSYMKYSAFGFIPGYAEVSFDWAMVEIARNEGTNYWAENSGRERALLEIQSFVLAHLMNEKEQKKLLGKLQDSVIEFEKIIEGAQFEELIQIFLKDNSYFLDPSALEIKPKVKLGTEHITDFVIVNPKSEYVLVEIENVKSKLFTTTGNPTHQLSHALRQVQDWKQWIRDNGAYARQSLPNINEPLYWVIIGRDKDLSEEETKRLQQMNSSSFPIRIMTYDEILRKIKQQIVNLQQLENSAPSIKPS